MVKKVVIAAAGEGTRMLHLTRRKSKHLIKVKERPFLSYLLDNIFNSGYKEIVLVVGYKGELIKEFLKDYNPPCSEKYKIITVSQYDILGPKEKEYGTACPLKCVENIIKKESFIYLCGDNLYSEKDLRSINLNGKYSYVAGICHNHPERYGVLETENGFLKKIIEKPENPPSNLINSGLYKFTPEVFRKISKIKKSPRGEYEITDVINLLAKEKKMKVVTVKDYWIDFGNPGDIPRLSKFLENNGNCKVKKSKS